jgi:hypothetical protein
MTTIEDLIDLQATSSHLPFSVSSSEQFVSKNPCITCNPFAYLFSDEAKRENEICFPSGVPHSAKKADHPFLFHQCNLP